MRLRGVSILAGALGWTGASAQLIVGNDQAGESSICYINTTSGASTPLFTSTSASAKPWGLAADNTNYKLYWCNGTHLYSSTFQSFVSSSPTISVHTLTYSSNAISFTGLAYDPVNHWLIGSRLGSQNLFKIDPDDGVCQSAWPLMPTGFTFSGYDFAGLDFAPNGDLYGAADITPSLDSRGLFQILNLTGPSSVCAYPDKEWDIDGLAVGDDGYAYLVTDGWSTAQQNFYKVNLTSHAISTACASPFELSGSFAGATFAPAMNGPYDWISGTLVLDDTAFSQKGILRRLSCQVKKGTETIFSGYVIAYHSSTAFSVPISSAHSSGSISITFDGTPMVREVATASLTGTDLNIGTVTVLNGDIDDSGEVDAYDIDLTISAFGDTWPAISNSMEDLDVTGEVDSVDIDVVIANFGNQDD